MFGLLPHDGLVQEHVVEHTPERVLAVLPARGFFNRFADGDSETARRFRIALEHLATGVRFGCRTREHLGAPALHHRPAVRFLLEAHLDHVDLAFQVEEVA